MSASTAQEIEIDEEELELDYEEKCNEVVELQAELHAARLTAQQLKMRWQADARGRCGAAVGPTMPGACVVGAELPEEERRAEELRPLVAWLADSVAWERPPEELEVNLEVTLSGRTVALQRVAQWTLSVPGAPGPVLRLSVPVHLQAEVASFLSARKTKSTAAGAHAALRAFAANWDLVPGELMVSAHPRQEPAVLLAHRNSQDGVLISTWPTREALDAFRALHSTQGEMAQAGDRVQVEYEGTWYVGTLHSIDATGKASVKCDVDEPGVYTIAPLHRVRNLRSGVSACGVAAGESCLDEKEAVAELLRHRLLTEDPAATAAAGGRAGVGPGHRRTRSAI